MGTTWFKNFVGLPQSDYELLKVPNPRLELGVHITIKCVQSGTLLGSIVGPAIQAYHGPRDTTSIRNSIVHGGWIGAGLGLVAGPLLSIYYANKLGDIATYDRCYRLRFNATQLTVDRMSALAAAVGYGISGPAGYVVGVDVALLATGALSAIWK